MVDEAFAILPDVIGNLMCCGFGSCLIIIAHDDNANTGRCDVCECKACQYRCAEQALFFGHLCKFDGFMHRALVRSATQRI